MATLAEKYTIRELIEFFDVCFVQLDTCVGEAHFIEFD